MWIFPWLKISWHSCSMWDKRGWRTWFWQFLCEGSSSFKPKGFWYSYAWSCSLYEGRSSLCVGLSQENSADSYLYFQLALLHSVSYSFFPYWSHSLSLCTAFDAISSSIDEVLLINPSANVFVFGDFMHMTRTGSPILVELIDLVNSVIIFLSQMTLLRWLTSLLGSLTVTLTVLLFRIYFSSFYLSIKLKREFLI